MTSVSDFTWLLWAFPMVFAMGWAFSRLDIWQWRRNPGNAPGATFRGLSLLLNEQQDEAIDAFIEAVQSDPDSSELHFALGNLFRRRGDYDRAIRVHEHLLARADLSQADHHRAQQALALDFLKAGLLDRAEAAYRALLDTRYQHEAQMALLGIYERTRDWEHARNMAQSLSPTETVAQLSSRLAHFACEQADAALRAGNEQQALLLFRQALNDHPNHVRACLGEARVLQMQEQHSAALQSLLACAQAHPDHWPLFAAAIPALAHATDRTDEMVQVLEMAYARIPSIDVVLALCALQPHTQSTRLLQHLESHTSIAVSHRWLQQHSGIALPQGVDRSLDKASIPQQRYRCVSCGFEARTWFWQCPGCQAWDSYPPRRVEEQS